jgi:hypothetical protein
VIPRKDPDNIGNFLRLNWSNIKNPILLHLLIPLLLKVLRKFQEKKDSYTDNSFLEGPNIDRLLKKVNYFDYFIGEIRKCVNKGEGYGEERTPTAIREPKCILVKEFVV